MTRSTLDRLTTAYVRQVIRFRYPVALLSIASMLILGLQTLELRIEAELDYFYDDEYQGLQDLKDLKSTYSDFKSTILMIKPLNEPISSPRILQLTHEITQKFWKMPHHVRVDSVTNYQHTEADGDDLIIRNLLESPDSLSEESARRIIDIASSKPELNYRMLSVENNALAVIAEARLDTDDNQALIDAHEFVSPYLADLRNRYPDVEFALTGIVPRNYLFFTLPAVDMQKLVSVMLVLLAVAIWILTGSIICPILTSVLVGASAFSAMGTAAILGIPVSTISAAAPIIILTVAVADAIHILTSYILLLGRGENYRAALIKSMEINAQPIFLTTVTTMIGFLSLNFSVSPPYRDLGNIAAMGAFYAWVLSMTFLPAALAIVKISPSQWVVTQSSAINALSRKLIGRKRPLFVMLTLTTLVTALWLPKLEFNDDFSLYFDESVPATHAMQSYMDNLAGLYQINLELKGSGPGSIYSREYLDNLKKLRSWLEAQPEIRHVHAIDTTFKNLNKSMNGDNEEYYRVSDNNELNAQYLLLYEMSLPYGLDINNFINFDKSASRVDVTTDLLKTREYIDLSHRIRDWLRGNTPAYMHVEPVSDTLLFSQIGVNNFESMKGGTLAALLGISACIGLLLGSFSMAIISLVLITAPFAVTFGIFAMSGQYLAAWTPFVIPTALGLVVDAVAHLLSKYHYARTKDGARGDEAVYYAFSTVGMALWISTLVLVMGFSVLYFASVTTLKLLGIGTALILFVALVVDVLALPSLIDLTDRLTGRTPKPGRPGY